MDAKKRKGTFAALLALSFFYVRLACAQAEPADSVPIPLTVQVGVPLHIALDKPLRIGHADVPIVGHVLEPIYVFDHLVIPAGSKVKGRVTEVEGVSRKRRALAIANGDFTPLRTAHFDFNTLVLKDGTHLALHTSVSEGEPQLVRLAAGEQDKKKQGRVSEAVGQAKQQAKQREQETIEAIKAPGKVQRVKSAVAERLPYRRQVLPVGTHFTAELKSPLELGTEEPQEPEQFGAEIPPGSMVYVRLLTSLSSATAHRGSLVRAVVSKPVFSPDKQLILPEGAHLEGSVTQALPARRLGRNGQLRFIFRQIDIPNFAPRQVEASLQSVDTTSEIPMKLDSEGGAHAVTPKTKFIAPAIDVLLATSSLDDLDGHFHHGIRTGVTHGPDVGGGAIRGGAGLGLVGSIIGMAAHYRPLSAGFAFYGAGLSVYTHVVARGADVNFPKNTAMEIRFGTHEGPPKPGEKPPQSVSQKAELAKPE